MVEPATTKESSTVDSGQRMETQQWDMLQDLLPHSEQDVNQVCKEQQAVLSHPMRIVKESQSTWRTTDLGNKNLLPANPDKNCKSGLKPTDLEYGEVLNRSVEIYKCEHNFG